MLLFSGHGGNWFIPIIGGAMIYGLALATFKSIDQELAQTATPLSYLNLFFGVAAIVCCVGFLSYWAILSIVVVLPLALLFAYVAYHDQQSLGRVFFLLRGAFWRTAGMSALLLVLGLTLFSITNTLVAELLFKMINWLVAAEQVVLDEWSVWINTFLLASIANFIWIILLLGFGLHYYSLREINEATDLRKKIAHIGQSSRIRGLERE